MRPGRLQSAVTSPISWDTMGHRLSWFRSSVFFPRDSRHCLPFGRTDAMLDWIKAPRMNLFQRSLRSVLLLPTKIASIYGYCLKTKVKEPPVESLEKIKEYRRTGDTQMYRPRQAERYHTVDSGEIKKQRTRITDDFIRFLCQAAPTVNRERKKSKLCIIFHGSNKNLPVSKTLVHY